MPYDMNSAKKREKKLAQLAERELRQAASFNGEEAIPAWADVPEWARPKRIWLEARPSYWRPRHFALAKEAARAVRLSYAEAGEALSAFFGPQSAWPESQVYDRDRDEYVARVAPRYRTDECGVWGPAVQNLVATAKRGGWHFRQMCRERLATYKSTDRHGHFGEEWFWSTAQRRWDGENDTFTGEITGGLSRRRWSRWKLCFKLRQYGVDPRALPWSILKGVDRLGPRSFKIARALLRQKQREQWATDDEYYRRPLRLDAESFFVELAAYIRGERDLRELASAMPRGDRWFLLHGQVPASEAVRQISKELIVDLADGRRMRFFLRLVRGEEGLAEHDAEAAARLAVWLGEKAESFVKKTGLSLHDAGINLPVGQTVTEEKVTFLFRYAHKTATAVGVVKNWEGILAHLGWTAESGLPHPLLSKSGLETAESVLKLFTYEGARHLELAQVAAECGVSQWEFTSIQEQWLGALEQLTHQTVPAPRPLEDGELRLSQLRKDDPRAVFAGVFTGCCQHPTGAGQSCARHAHASPDGAIWAVEKNGRMIAQAWVWRSGDALVLDSVEASASTGEETRVRVKALFQRAAESVLDKLCVQQVFVGTGFGGVHWKELDSAPRPFQPPTIYDDSRNVWLIAGKSAEE